MTQLYNGDDHKTIGPAEPPDRPEGADDRRLRLRETCEAYEFESDSCEANGRYCSDNVRCPLGNW
jgi:hypothetical protein